MKSRILNLLEPSRPVEGCNGMALPVQQCMYWSYTACTEVTNLNVAPLSCVLKTLLICGYNVCYILNTCVQLAVIGCCFPWVMHYRDTICSCIFLKL